MSKVQFLNGILSGKLGGTVYAHNKAGYYVRQYSIPTNPATDAQMAARAVFTNALTGWHGLSDAEKSAWNTFATSNYAAFLPKTGVLYSGFNAFTALRTIAQNGSRLARSYTMDADNAGSPVELTFTEGSFTVPTVAPAMGFSSNIKTSTLEPLPQIMTNASFASDGTGSFEVSFPGLEAVKPFWVDYVGGIDSGYAVFASNALSQGQEFATKPYLHLVGIINPPTVTTGWPVGGSQKVTFTFDTADLDIPSRKLWYVTGDFCKISVVCIGSNGQMQHLNTLAVEIS